MSELPSKIVRLADLPNRKGMAFTIEPDAAARTALATELGVQNVKKIRFSGRLSPLGKRDWQLDATLGASIQQSCVVTLDPMTTRIDDDITRLYVTEFEIPEGDEVEMPEDDSVEPLPETLDLADVMIEALTLSIPAYPRKDGVATGTSVFTEPGKAAMTDEDARPFAGLAALRDSLENKDKGDE